MKTYTNNYNMRETSQSVQAPGTVPNSAGGHSFAIDMWTQLDRFLILGSEGGTYYIKERKLTVDNADNVIKCIKTDGKRVVDRIVKISEAGRAPKNDPALFALALATAYGDDFTVSYAYQNLSKVARIGTHLFHFAEFRKLVGGWGSGMKRAVGRWYTEKDADQLGYQLIKYRQRDGWTHTDLLRLAHPRPLSDRQDALFAWVTKGTEVPLLPRIIEGFLKIQKADNAKAAVGFINEYGLPREAVPTEFLNDKNVWEALLYAGNHGMPLGAMIRNLNKMTAVGLLQPMGEATSFVSEKLLGEEGIRRSRIHPLAVLNALFTYSSGGGGRNVSHYGRGFKTKTNLSWKPLQPIVDSLDETFYISFGNVEPTNKRVMLALDISASMTWSLVGGTMLTPREAAGAMAMVTARTERPNSYMIMAFSHGIEQANVSPRQRLDTVIKNINGLRAGGTDCALPMTEALKKKWPIDSFVVYTDSETWYGDIHPFQALRKYRNKMGIPAKLVVVGMEANGFSIADPKDAGMLDVVGFDTAAPNVISDFIRE
jgi:60 kDa SS-A/Ro ribonucleoprotein